MPENAQASVPLAIIEDPALSWGAKGLLLFLLAHGEENLTEAVLIAASRNGQVLTRRLLRELRNKELIYWRQRREPGGALVEETFRFAGARERFGDVKVDGRLNRPNRPSSAGREPMQQPIRKRPIRRLDFDVR
jgi:hypothetical protein